MHLSIERRMLIGFSLVVILTLFITGASLQVAARQKDLDRWVTRSHQVQTQLQHVLALVTKAEAGERGFILTGDIDFIDSRTDEFSDIEPEVTSLGRLIADNSVQQSNLVPLRLSVLENMTLVERVIRLRKQGNSEAARKTASSIPARVAMKRLEQSIEVMEQEESLLLKQRTEAVETYQQDAQRLFVCLLPLVLVSLALVYFGVGATHRKTITTLESISDAFFALDPCWKFTYANSQAEILLQRKKTDLLGKTLWEVFPGAEETPFGQQYHLDGEEKATRRFEAFYAPSEQWVEVTAYVSKDGLSVYLHDITERKRAEERLSRTNELLGYQVMLVNQQAVDLKVQKAELEDANRRLTTLSITDGLTGLYNHRTFQNKLEEELKRAQRYNVPVSVILLDVDKFKMYNDTFGHPEGDIVLKKVALALQAAARNTDCVCRYGGEEFVIVLPNTEGDGAKEAAERFRAAIEETAWPFRSITASFGVSTFYADVITAQELIAQADRALYVSKEHGRNRVTHFADNVLLDSLIAYNRITNS